MLLKFINSKDSTASTGNKGFDPDSSHQGSTHLVSNPRTMAPMDLAAPAEASPATPPPTIRI